MPACSWRPAGETFAGTGDCACFSSDLFWSWHSDWMAVLSLLCSWKTRKMPSYMYTNVLQVDMTTSLCTSELHVHCTVRMSHQRRKKRWLTLGTVLAAVVLRSFALVQLLFQGNSLGFHIYMQSAFYCCTVRVQVQKVVTKQWFNFLENPTVPSIFTTQRGVRSWPQTWVLLGSVHIQDSCLNFRQFQQFWKENRLRLSIVTTLDTVCFV